MGESVGSAPAGAERLAACMGVTVRTVQRDWNKARLLLFSILRSD